MVFRSAYDTIGKPVKLFFWYKIGDAINEIKKGETWHLDIPWHETRGTEIPFNLNNVIKKFQYDFIGLNQPPLSKGTYYTEFTKQFCLEKYGLHPEGKSVCTDTLHLKINFEVK
jgi:hypothetical protein